MTKERLEELAEDYATNGIMGAMDSEAMDLFRLARLGLWAEEHGIPKLEIVWAGYSESARKAVCMNALAALPTRADSIPLPPT